MADTVLSIPQREPSDASGRAFGVSAWEPLFAVIGLLFLLGAFMWVFNDLRGVRDMGVDGRGPDSGGNTKFQVFSIIVYLISAGILMNRYYQLVWVLRRNIILICLISVVLLSALWSIDPAVTARRAVALLGTSLFGLYLALRFTPVELVRLLGWSLLIFAVASFGFAVLFPDFGIHNGDVHDGLWRGITDHKNTLGKILTLGVALFLFLAITGVFPRIWSWFGFTLCAFMIVMSGSATALISMIVLLFVLWVLFRMRSAAGSNFGWAVILGVAASVIFFGYFAVVFYEDILAAIGRDATLTGRTGLWEKAISAGADRPILGYGYKVFWSREHAGVLFNRFDIQAGFGHAHNSFVDIWLDLGIVGLGLFLATLWLVFSRLFFRLTQKGDVMSVWFGALIAFEMLAGMTGGSILKQGTIEWALYVATVVYLSLPMSGVTSGGGMKRRAAGRH